MKRDVVANELVSEIECSRSRRLLLKKWSETKKRRRSPWAFICPEQSVTNMSNEHT